MDDFVIPFKMEWMISIGAKGLSRVSSVDSRSYE